jgi:hypothetical protein
MVVNPRILKWRAPTQNTDGTPITYELGYHLYVGATPVASFPGSLSPDGNFEVLFADLSLDIDGEVDLGMKAFDAANPNRISEMSQTVRVGFFANPQPPENVAVGA